MIGGHGAKPHLPREGLTPSELSTARLLFDAELGRGIVNVSDLVGTPSLKEAVAVRGIPSRASRGVQRLLFKAGALSWERMVEGPLAAARRTVLAEGARASPRFLVRVDEFPNYRAWDEAGQYGTAAYERFHMVMRSARLPYLVAVLPRVSEAPLDPLARPSRPLTDGETSVLRRLAGEGVAFGAHGLSHRTRFASPRRHSELCGLGARDTKALLDDSLRELAGRGLDAEVFVPPYNRFDAKQLSPLGRRFAVVCGGPESIGTLGFHSTPQWRRECVYLPAYPPFYGAARDVLQAARAAIERQSGLWIPIVLHWEWEQRDGWRSLRELAETIAPHAVDWRDFLAAVHRSGRAEER